MDTKTDSFDYERLMNRIQPDKSEIENLLLSSLVDTSKTIEKPPTVLSRIEPDAGRYIYRRLFTLGNFSCLIGKAKSKKTFLLSLLTASVIKSNENFQRNIFWCNSVFNNFDGTITTRSIQRRKPNFEWFIH